MHRAKMLLAVVVVAGAIIVTGCAKPQDLEKLRADLLAQIAQQDRSQQDRVRLVQDKVGKLETNDERQVQRIEAAEKRVEEVAKIPSNLEAAVNAVMKYARDVEKDILKLRELTARELDRQNSHIRKVKASYKSVLDQEIQAISAMRKALDTAMADLRATVEKSATVLGEALPDSDETMPPAPPLPKNLKIEGGGGLNLPGAPPPPKPTP